ncbi:hypothetical protein T09_11190, partial [Trichinella sp. T9]
LDGKERGCRWFGNLAVAYRGRSLFVVSNKHYTLYLSFNCYNVIGKVGSRKKGKQSQAEMTARGNPPFDTGSSSLSDECANSAITEVPRAGNPRQSIQRYFEPHRCAKNAEIERIEAMVAEMDSIFSLAEDLQGSYEELLNEDDLTTKTMKPSVTETTERKAAGGEEKELCNLRIPKWQLTPFAGDIMQFGAFWINMMGGVALRKLSYIAIKVAKKHKPTLNNKLYTTPPDYAYLDELIKKYFPDEIGNFRGVYLVHLYGPVTSGSNKRGYLIRMAESTKSQELSSSIREMDEDYKIYKDCKKQH